MSQDRTEKRSQVPVGIRLATGISEKWSCGSVLSGLKAEYLEVTEGHHRVDGICVIKRKVDGEGAMNLAPLVGLGARRTEASSVETPAQAS